MENFIFIFAKLKISGKIYLNIINVILRTYLKIEV